MAGFFLWHDSEDINPFVVNEGFLSLDYKQGQYLNYDNWHVIIFPKELYNINNFVKQPDGIICGVGTFAYKGEVYDQALPQIYYDVMHDCLNQTAFWGNFIIAIITKQGLTFIRDGAGLTRLYQKENKLIFTTSFAGLIDCSVLKLNLDHEAVTELLVTGLISSSQTILKEIKSINIGQKPETINLIETAAPEIDNPRSRNEAILQQINIVKDYFEEVTHDWINYMPESVFDVGVTGGLDSRLNAALVINNKPGCSNLVFHTHWRKDKFDNKDFYYAHVLSEAMSLPMNTKETISPLDMSEQQLEVNFELAYRINDGDFRPGIYWDEASNTAPYRAGLTEPAYLRFLGYGGEQYRNVENIPLKSSSNLRDWIRWEMIYKFTFLRGLLSKKAEKQLVSYIEKNIRDRLGQVNLNLYNYKKFIQLFQSPSYRAIKSRMENRIGFCISPFLDTRLSVSSLQAIPFLGSSMGFQLEMLKKINPKVASIPNKYGFNFSEGESFKSKASASIWYILPLWFKYPLYSRTKKFNRSNFVPMLSEKHEFIKSLEHSVIQVGLPIDLARYRLVSTRSRFILNLGYFLKRNSDKVNI